MSPASPADPASPVSPAAEARDERQEWDRLMQRRRVLAPEDRCFCGSIEDLRRYVADLEARQVRHPSQHEQEHDQPEREIEDEEFEP